MNEFLQRKGPLFNFGDGWWRPVAVDGDTVTATRLTHGCHMRQWRQYASPAGANAAARRLRDKLAKTQTEAEFNAVIDHW